MASCLSTNRNEISIPYRGPSIDASYQVLVHLAKRFQRRRFFLEINQSETRIACVGYVCQRIGTKCGIFREDLPLMLPKNRPIRNKNCLWPSSLLMNRDKMGNLYREPFIDASYQVTVHFAKQF